MVGPLLAGVVISLLSAPGRPHPTSEPETAAAGVLLLWLCLSAAFGLLLFWGLPVAVAALVAQGRGHHPASALLWAGLLGWIGLLVFLYRGAAKRCPHCHTRVVAETTLCYWCGSDTLPVPLPEFLRERRPRGWG